MSSFTSKKLHDFDSLYEDSLQLTNHIEDNGIPILQRGIDQLGEASRKLAQVT